MSYEDARGRIQTVLGTISITSPVSAKIKKVYADPPGTIGDHPCFIMYGSSGTVEWAVGGAAIEETHTERVRLYIYDSDLDRAANLVRAFRAAMLVAFKPEGGLSAFATVAEMRWDEPGSVTYGKRDYTVQDFFITFHVLAP